MRKVLRKLFLNGFLLRDKLSAKVYFRPIGAFPLNSGICSGIDPHLLVHYETHTPSSETRPALVAFLGEHYTEAQASTVIWEEKEEICGTEEKWGFLVKKGNVTFSLSVSC